MAFVRLLGVFFQAEVLEVMALKGATFKFEVLVRNYGINFDIK